MDYKCVPHPAYNREGFRPVVNLVCSEDAFEYPNDIEMKLEGNTPPEDVGKESGYEEFLEIIADKNNLEHDGMLAWGQSRRYKEFDIEMVNKKLKDL